MPNKFNDGRRCKIPKAKYRVANSPDYDAALVRRGAHGVGDGGSRGGMACASDRPARRSTGLSPSPKFQHSSR